MKAIDNMRPKENALPEFIQMTKKSWTYARLTEPEQRRCIAALENARGLKGNFAQRVEHLNDMYSSFLAALNYSPFGWREPDSDEQTPLF